VEEIVLKKMSSNISKKMLQHFAKYWQKIIVKTNIFKKMLEHFVKNVEHKKLLSNISEKCCNFSQKAEKIVDETNIS
jgi:hypothetical protein